MDFGNVPPIPGMYLEEKETFLSRTMHKISPKFWKRKVENIKVALNQESDETKEMISIYIKKMHGTKLSKEDIKKANKQFADILRMVGLGVFVALPIPGLSIVFFAFVGLAKKFNIRILPTSFVKKDE